MRDLAACARGRWERGEFAPARVGTAGRTERREQIRGDRICWLAEPLLAAEAQLLGALEHLRLALNREATLGLFDLEMHYARYPNPGRPTRATSTSRRAATSGGYRSCSI